MICYRAIIVFLLSLSLPATAKPRPKNAKNAKNSKNAKPQLKKSCTASCQDDVQQQKICATVKECTRKRCSIWARNGSVNSFCCSDSDCATRGYRCRAKMCVAPLPMPRPIPITTAPPPTLRPTTRMPTPRPSTVPPVIPITLDVIVDALEATVPATFLERFPDQVFQQIMQDSPSGFVPGSLRLGPQSEDLPDFDAETPIMDFEVSGEGDSLELDGYFIPIE